MPKLKDGHELFAQEYLKDLNQTAAAQRAGYKHPGVKGAQLYAREDVQARIKELQAEIAKRNDITVDTIIDNLVEDRKLANEAKQHSAAVSADIAIAKVAGVWIDRVQHEDGKSDAQLAESLAVLLAPILGKDSAEIKAAVAALLKGETPALDILGNSGTLH